METLVDLGFSVTVKAVTNEMSIQGSILPDRFVSESTAQPHAIVDATLGATVRTERPIGSVVVPAAAIF